MKAAAAPIHFAGSHLGEVRHHGRIWAAPNDGPGATFAFSIPRRPQDATGARGPDIIPPPPMVGPKQAMRFP
jgi:hypothetical protein